MISMTGRNQSLGASGELTVISHFTEIFLGVIMRNASLLGIMRKGSMLRNP